MNEGLYSHLVVVVIAVESRLLWGRVCAVPLSFPFVLMDYIYAFLFRIHYAPSVNESIAELRQDSCIDSRVCIRP